MMTSDALADPDRLAALARTGLMDGELRPSLQRFTRIASQALGVPVSLLSLVDDHRQFFAAAHGLEGPIALSRQTPLSHSFCQQVVHRREALIVEDARADDRVRTNLAIEHMRVIAYAGTPVVDSRGHVIGSFCAIDHRPRSWSPADLALLEDIAAAVTREIVLLEQIQDQTVFDDRIAHTNAELERLLEGDRQMHSVVHDLRSPLQVIRLGLDDLAQVPSLQTLPQSGRMIALMQRSVLHAVTLLEGIDQAQERSDGWNSGELVTLVDGLLDEARMTAPHLLTRRIGYPRVMPRLDSRALRRALGNIIENARRFACQSVVVTLADDDDGIRILVDDDGAGLPDEAAYAAAWQRGVRLHEDSAQSQTGLGLSITADLITSASGRLIAGPSGRGGARFGFWLPGS
ncbi:MAG: GAF domain-containing sensor histidine kinase [Burkholderiaceae bacterium]